MSSNHGPKLFECAALLSFAVTAWLAAAETPGGEEAANLPPAGPREPTGPDVPLSDAEKAQFAQPVTAAGQTAAAVQLACDRAAKASARTVFLPAGEYAFDTEIRVPGRLTLLGEGSKTRILAKDKSIHLFSVKGELVRFTRLKLQGADSSLNEDNDTYGISVSGGKDVRIDRCELSGFSYATNFADQATAQVDHCLIHHNLRDGLGYGVAIYSGAYVLISDNEFSQNRHSLASNGALDWSSPKRVGRYVHKPEVRKSHWEFIHNRVDGNDLSHYELAAVDTHPGMDGTFVIEKNLFENLRHGIGIRDGSGLIRSNLFRNFRGKPFRPFIAISISYGTHNDIPVEGCMPHDIVVESNVFSTEGAKYEKVHLDKAENIVVDGRLIPETKAERPAPQPIPLLTPMDAEGKLGISRRAESLKPSPRP